MSCCGGQGLGINLTTVRELQWNPAPNSAVVPISDGVTSSSTGTLTARGVSTVSLLDSLPRIGMVSAVAINSVAGNRSPQLVAPVGSTTAQLTAGPFRLGRWNGLFDFGISDAVLNTEAKMLVGWSTLTGAPTAVDPAAHTDMIGFGHDTGDTTLRFYANSNGTFEEVNLGADFPIALGNVFRVMVACRAEPLSGANVPPYDWAVINAKTGAVRTGTAQPGNGPRTGGVGIAPRLWRSTGPAITLAVGIDLIWMRMKVEL